MKKVFLLFLCLGLIAGLALYFLRGSRPVPEPPPVVRGEAAAPSSPYDRIPPVACRLAVLPGAGEQPALLTLRLYSSRLRQAHLDQGAGLAGNDASLPPLSIETAPELWRREVHFFTVDRQTGHREDISAAVTLVKAPKAATLLFAPDTVHAAHYTLSRQASLAPGGAIQAELRLPYGLVRSNLAEMAPVTQDEDEVRSRTIAIAHRLGDYGTMLRQAEELIARRPQAPEGYYFQGLGLEGQGAWREALAAYRQALARVKAPEAGRFQEPPDLLFEHIRRVEQRLSR